MKVKLVDILKKLEYYGHLDILEDSLKIGFVLELLDDLNDRELSKELRDYVESKLEPLREKNEKIEVEWEDL